MKFFKNTKIGRTISGLVREGAQTLPVVGTVITAWKEDTPDNPKGKIKLTKWEFYRIILGLVIGYVLYKGILTIDQIEFIAKMMQMFGGEVVPEMILLLF